MGVGAAAIMPTTLSVITTSFPEAERGRAIGVWVGIAGGGAIIGLFVTALLLEWFPWSSFFGLNVAFAVVGALDGGLRTAAGGGEELSPRIALHPAPYALHAAVVPLAGRLRVAGTAEFAGFDARPTEARIANLTRLLGKVLPQLSLDGLELNAWAGLRPMSADGRPLLGQAGPSNLFLNTGHGALGWTHANASGQLVAGLVMGLKPSEDIAPFLASRIE